MEGEMEGNQFAFIWYFEFQDSSKLNGVSVHCQIMIQAPSGLLEITTWRSDGIATFLPRRDFACNFDTAGSGERGPRLGVL